MSSNIFCWSINVSEKQEDPFLSLCMETAFAGGALADRENRTEWVTCMFLLFHLIVHGRKVPHFRADVQR